MSRKKQYQQQPEHQSCDTPAAAKWPDGTPKSQNNAFTSYQPIVQPRPPPKLRPRSAPMPWYGPNTKRGGL